MTEPSKPPECPTCGRSTVHTITAQNFNGCMTCGQSWEPAVSAESGEPLNAGLFYQQYIKAMSPAFAVGWQAFGFAEAYASACVSRALAQRGKEVIQQSSGSLRRDLSLQMGAVPLITAEAGDGLSLPEQYAKELIGELKCVGVDASLETLEFVNERAEAAESRIAGLEQEQKEVLEKLLNPVDVWTNMLLGRIAIPQQVKDWEADSKSWAALKEKQRA